MSVDTHNNVSDNDYNHYNVTIDNILNDLTLLAANNLSGRGNNKHNNTVNHTVNNTMNQNNAEDSVMNDTTEQGNDNKSQQANDINEIIDITQDIQTHRINNIKHNNNNNNNDVIIIHNNNKNKVSHKQYSAKQPAKRHKLSGKGKTHYMNNNAIDDTILIPKYASNVSVTELQALSENDCVCCICLLGDSTDENAIVFCDGICNLAYHQYCVSLDYLPADNWYCCTQCKNKKADIDVLEKNVNELRKLYKKRLIDEKQNNKPRRRNISRSNSRYNRRQNSSSNRNVSSRNAVHSNDTESEHVKKLWLKVLPYFIPPTHNDIQQYLQHNDNNNVVKLPRLGLHYIDQWKSQDSVLGIRSRTYKRYEAEYEQISDTDDELDNNSTDMKNKFKLKRELTAYYPIDKNKNLLRKRVLKAAKKAAKHKAMLSLTATLTTKQDYDNSISNDIVMNSHDETHSTQKQPQMTDDLDELNDELDLDNNDNDNDTDDETELQDAIEPLAAPYFTLRAQDISVCLNEGTMDNKRLRQLIQYNVTHYNQQHMKQLGNNYDISSPVKRDDSTMSDIYNDSNQQYNDNSNTSTPSKIDNDEIDLDNNDNNSINIISPKLDRERTGDGYDKLAMLPSNLLTSCFYSDHYVPPIQLYNTTTTELTDIDWLIHNLSYELHDIQDNSNEYEDIFQQPELEDMYKLDEISCEFYLLNKELQLQTKLNNDIKDELLQHVDIIDINDITQREQQWKNVLTKYEKVLKYEYGTLSCNLHSHITQQPLVPESSQARRKRERRERRNNGESDVSSSSDDESDDDSQSVVSSNVKQSDHRARQRLQRELQKQEKLRLKHERETNRIIHNIVDKLVDTVCKDYKDYQKQERDRLYRERMDEHNKKKLYAKQLIERKREQENIKICERILNKIVDQIELDIEPDTVKLRKKEQAKQRRQSKKLAKLEELKQQQNEQIQIQDVLYHLFVLL